MLCTPPPPRRSTLEQAKKLDEMLAAKGTAIDAVLDFAMPDSLLVRWLARLAAGRRRCSLLAARCSLLAARCSHHTNSDSPRRRAAAAADARRRCTANASRRRRAAAAVGAAGRLNA
jgi:adenylate kinase family enzyme